MAKTTKTIVETTRFSKAAGMARKGTLAYLGLYVSAYDAVKPLFAKTEGVFADMVVKGEAIETQTRGVVAIAGVKAGEMATKVREALPLPAANDRLVAAKSAKPSSKIASKKKTTAKKTAVKTKTIKTVKAA
ncbi:MAG: hypothetical protein V3U82_05680 [Robiginitomaculum sp.]